MNDISSNALALLGIALPPTMLQLEVALSVLAVLIAIVSRHRPTIIGAAFAVIMAAIMSSHFEDQGVLLICGFAALHAFGGFERQAHQSRLQSIESDVQAMSVLMNTFLDGLERRTREREYALNAAVIEDQALGLESPHKSAAE
ncbi:hypothetical protein HNQ72_005630 [Rhizobium wenxiniae]|uniref:Uncharacterized protein n=1 Tax=Rhizobium wenxiniae TaxID=1737357 RepID=A0A7W9YBX1_9HYPH|nr:hypothetical protein [Rhizobium wenxiniae]MBB6165782.1 hypothetical protein [Rhizobium wenxiniae]